MRTCLLLCALLLGCSGASDPAADLPRASSHEVTADVAPPTDAENAPEVVDTRTGPLALRIVTFNVGTSSQVLHDKDEEEGNGDGYTSAQADFIDAHFGNSLAWAPAEDALRAWLAQEKPDIVAFQEMMFDPWCDEAPEVPAELNLTCKAWQETGQYMAQRVLGEDYQVAHTASQPDDWIGVRREVGRFVGCPEEGPCLDGIGGQGIEGCNKGARIGGIEVELKDGRRLVVVKMHTNAGMTDKDMACRVLQIDQVFVDQGDGTPAACGEHNLVLGDLNTDPFILAASDTSAVHWQQFVGPGKPYDYVSAKNAEGPATHITTMRIDHVVSDTLVGSCVVPGESPGLPLVMETSFFDHRPVLCDVVW